MIAVSRAVGLVAALLMLADGAGAATAQPVERVATAVSCPATVAELTSAQVDSVFMLASRKLAAAARVQPGRYPFGALDGASDYQRTGPTGWTSGFFPGELWLMFERTKQARWLDQARAWTTPLLPMANYRGSHDLGFMVGIPTSLGRALEPGRATRATYARAQARAARTLARRWNGRVRAIKSADYGNRWGVIVDSAMNAPMLVEVGDRLQGSAGARLRSIGIGHMRTLARDFIRPDGSTYHRIAYDPRTGRRLGPIPGQGYDPRTSTWARGQAWAIAGFAWAYERTGDPQFLDAATRTAQFWMDHVPAGCVPAWDLAIDNPRAPRDSSALAIVASGLLHLADAMDDRQLEGQVLRAYARAALGTLASPAWTTATSANPGILRRQTLSVPADPREGTYVWGDYYLLDALMRAERAGLPASGA